MTTPNDVDAGSRGRFVAIQATFDRIRDAWRRMPYEYRDPSLTILLEDMACLVTALIWRQNGWMCIADLARWSDVEMRAPLGGTRPPVQAARRPR